MPELNENIDLKQELIDTVIEKILEDIAQGDLTALDELLKHVPLDNLIAYLPEEKWFKFLLLK